SRPSYPQSARPRRLFGAPTSKEPVSGPVFIQRFVQGLVLRRDSWSSAPPLLSKKPVFDPVFLQVRKERTESGRLADGQPTAPPTLIGTFSSCQGNALAVFEPGQTSMSPTINSTSSAVRCAPGS